MKKLLLLLLATAFSFTFIAAENHPTINSDSKNMELEERTPIKSTGQMSHPRSIYFLEACYIISIGEIEVIHDNLKDTDIYLFDSSGNVLYHTHIYSLNYSIDSIPVPSLNGVYTLVIDSEIVYASGILSIQ